MSDAWKAPIASSPDDEVSFVLGLLAFTTADPDRLAPAAQAKTAEWLLKLAALGADQDCALYLAPPGEKSVTFEVRVLDESGGGRQPGLGAGEALRAAAQAIAASAERVEVVVESGTRAQNVVLSSTGGTTVFFDPRADRAALPGKEAPAASAVPSPPVDEAGTAPQTGPFDAEIGDPDAGRQGSDEPDPRPGAGEPSNPGIARRTERSQRPAPEEPAPVAEAGWDEDGPGFDEAVIAEDRAAGPVDRLAKLGEQGFGRSTLAGDLARVARSQGPRPATDRPGAAVPTVDDIAGRVAERLARGLAPLLQALDELRSGTAEVLAAVADGRAQFDAQLSRGREESAREALDLGALVEDLAAQATHLRQESAAEIARLQAAVEASRLQGEASIDRVLDVGAADTAALQAALLLSRSETEVDVTRVLEELRAGMEGVHVLFGELRADTETYVRQMVEEVRAGVRAAAAHSSVQAEFQVARVMEEFGAGVARIDAGAQEARDRFDLVDAELSASVGFQRLAADEFAALREDVALVADMRGEIEALRAEVVALKRRTAVQARSHAADLKPEQLDSIADAIAARLLKSVGFEAGR